MNSINALIAGAGTGLIIGLAIYLAIIIFIFVGWWKIFSKAGYKGAMSLLLLVPIANVIVFCILAFGRWPIHDELDQLRQQAATGQQYQQPPQYQQPSQNQQPQQYQQPSQYQQPQQYQQPSQYQQPPQYPQR